jgi:lipopolysaccharide export system protein LptC
MASVAGYTRFVELFKYSLWGLAAVIVVAVVWVAEDKSGEGGRIVLSNVPKSGNLQNIMLKPHYQGIDSHDRPFTVIADQATQLDADNVSMNNVRADMTAANGAWVALVSGTGVLNLQTKQLELHDKVDMFYDGGYDFRSDHAHVDIQKGTAYGDSAIEGQGPPGTLKADSFAIDDHGAVIHFNGSVRMKLYR